MTIELGHLDTLPARRAGRQVADGPVSKEPLRLKLYVALIVVDSLAMVGGFAVGNLMRFGDVLNAQGINLGLVLLQSIWEWR